jgi:hypothetical protein
MKKKYADGGMFREGMPVPQDVDGASAPMKKPIPKRPMPAMKKPAPKGAGMFREGMPVPQDVDGASVKPFKKGGSVGSASKRADGIAKKGKTKGTQVKMAGGGKC